MNRWKHASVSPHRHVLKPKNWLSIQTFGLDESLRFFAFSIFRVAFSLFRVVFSFFRVAFSSCWFRFFGFAAVELHQCYQVKLIVYWSRKSEKTKRKTEKVCRGACTLLFTIEPFYQHVSVQKWQYLTHYNVTNSYRCLVIRYLH